MVADSLYYIVREMIFASQQYLKPKQEEINCLWTLGLLLPFLTFVRAQTASQWTLIVPRALWEGQRAGESPSRGVSELR